jgi:hypothetical protein
MHASLLLDTRGLISLCLYKENNKLWDWKNVFTLHIPPCAPYSYGFVVLTCLPHPGKIVLVVLQIRQYEIREAKDLSAPLRISIMETDGVQEKQLRLIRKAQSCTTGVGSHEDLRGSYNGHTFHRMTIIFSVCPNKVLTVWMYKFDIYYNWTIRNSLRLCRSCLQCKFY